MEEIEKLRGYIRDHGIRRSLPRERIIRLFLETERHLSIQELAALVHRTSPGIGIATVYRAMKVACEAGLAREIDFGNGEMRYEHLYGHEHHDHLVCISCGTFREVTSEKIEKEQEKIAATHNFTLLRHRHMLYGLCPACKKSS